MGANLILQGRMQELGLTQDELAGQLNKALLEITGRPGEISSRTIRNLLSGRHSRPSVVRVQHWSAYSAAG
ncbi:hypothetical protein OHB54_02175 [Streptomyces sp. NBC_01007]|nr:hypothetical protein OHB54_02175 [Streptomyces sp. NBC_01007]